MTTTAVIVLVVAVLLVAGAVWYLARKRAAIKRQYGPEYERTVRETGSARRAEALLDARTRRVRHYDIRPLKQEERTRFSEAWRRLQSKFVDSPEDSVAEADRLVTELMSTRGYPMTDFERQAEDLSVDHPEVVSHYRVAHRLAIGQGISTEELRQAVKHYRVLFEDLLGGPEARVHA
ncbi:MAG TPA: hypothetical protein VFV78_06100 [Vicinamibacterales bacterium]|nr:hypothetical protein [Vicinamibacterales bacterium]